MKVKLIPTERGGLLGDFLMLDGAKGRYHNMVPYFSAAWARLFLPHEWTHNVVNAGGWSNRREELSFAHDVTDQVHVFYALSKKLGTRSQVRTRPVLRR